MPKLYDCCMFHNEVDMLELRMSILDPVVDCFVVCEANETHSGLPKPFNLDKHLDRFDKWSDKIVYVQVDGLSGHGRNSWEREKYHRSMLAAGLIGNGVQEDDWVLVGDCDEIANPNVLQIVKQHPYMTAVKLELDFYYYNVQHRVKQGWAIGMNKWSVDKDPNHIRTCLQQDQYRGTFYNAGWHFSYFMSPDQIVDKLNSFMHHADVAADVPRDPGYIASRMTLGQDIYQGRELVIEQVDDENTLPPFLVANRDHYAKLGWINEL